MDLSNTNAKTGKFLFLTALWALLAVPTGAFLYAAAIYFQPWLAVGIFALFLITFLNGYAVMAIASFCGRLPRQLLFAAAAVIGILSLYFAWVSWVWMLNDFWNLGLIFDPLRLTRILWFVANDNFRMMGERPVAVPEWLLYWSLEALALLLIPTAVIRNALLKRQKKEVSATDCAQKHEE